VSSPFVGAKRKGFTRTLPFLRNLNFIKWLG